MANRFRGILRIRDRCRECLGKQIETLTAVGDWPDLLPCPRRDPIDGVTSVYDELEVPKRLRKWMTFRSIFPATELVQRERPSIENRIDEIHY
jgi:hypothetical protein